MMSYHAKYNANRLLGSPEVKVDKANIKFNRRQQPPKFERRKMESSAETSERICFISPNRTNSSSSNFKSNTDIPSPNMQADIQVSRIDLKTPRAQLTPRSEPYLNDSIFSLYEELKSPDDVRKERDLRFYKEEAEKLYDELTQCKLTNMELEKDLKDLGQMEKFMMERETHISKLVEENVILTEKVQILQENNEELEKEAEAIERKHEREVKQLEDEIERLKTENGFMLTLNLEMSQKVAKLAQKQSKTERKLKKSRSSAMLSQSPPAPASPQTPNRTFLTDQTIIDVPPAPRRRRSKGPSKLNSPDGFHFHSMDEITILQTMNDSRQCEGQLIKTLKQKVRYSEIEIDILKKMKGEADDRAQKMTKETKRLKERIRQMEKYLTRRRKRDRSGSSLQLSLSPSKPKRAAK